MMRRDIVKLAVASTEPNAASSAVPETISRLPFSPSKPITGPSNGLIGLPTTLPPGLKSRTRLGFVASLVRFNSTLKFLKFKVRSCTPMKLAAPPPVLSAV